MAQAAECLPHKCTNANLSTAEKERERERERKERIVWYIINKDRSYN
jgi:hypothetical protein